MGVWQDWSEGPGAAGPADRLGGSKACQGGKVPSGIACLVKIWFSSLLNSFLRLGNSGGIVSVMDGYLGASCSHRGKQGIDDCARKPALLQDTEYMVEKTYHVTPYLGAFGAYLMPR